MPPVITWPSGGETQLYLALSYAGQHELALEHFRKVMVLAALNRGYCVDTHRAQFDAIAMDKACVMLAGAASALAAKRGAIWGLDLTRTDYPYSAVDCLDDDGRPIATSDPSYQARHRAATLMVAALREDLDTVVGVTIAAYTDGGLGDLACCMSRALWDAELELRMTAELTGPHPEG